MDKRTAKGLRALNVWVTPELGKQLDEARGLIPMQRYVVFLLDQAMGSRPMSVQALGKQAAAMLALRGASPSAPIPEENEP